MPVRTVTAQLLRLSPSRRRLLLITANGVLLPLPELLSFRMWLEHPFTSNFIEQMWLLPAAWMIGLPLYVLCCVFSPGHSVATNSLIC